MYMLLATKTCAVDLREKKKTKARASPIRQDKGRLNNTESCVGDQRKLNDLHLCQDVPQKTGQIYTGS